VKPSEPVSCRIDFRASVALAVALLFSLLARASDTTLPSCSQPPALQTSGTFPSVCNDVTLDAQVKNALRQVCMHDRTSENTPVDDRVIVVGFLGGFVKHGDRKHPEVWFAHYLRERYPSIIFAEAYSNHEEEKAVREVLTLLDTNCDGMLSESEKAKARIIIYGHSWGASETTAFAKELGRHAIPVLLTVQVDTVPKPHQKPMLIPPNVERAVNFFETSGGLLHGQSRIVAVDPAQTRIVGNFQMTYQNNHVDCKNFPWFARTFNKPHHEIENDSRVWAQIDVLIDANLRPNRQAERTRLAVNQGSETESGLAF